MTAQWKDVFVRQALGVKLYGNQGYSFHVVM